MICMVDKWGDLWINTGRLKQIKMENISEYRKMAKQIVTEIMGL